MGRIGRPRDVRFRDLVVRPNDKGRGVYAARVFEPGEILDRSPVIVWPRGTEPDAYIDIFVWTWADSSGRLHKRDAVPLGILSMINHSRRPNARVRRFYRDKLMVCRAARRIRAGEEILIDYGPAADNFEVIESRGDRS